ncbi:Hypothetical predicted protein [Octopus vulgaris]|uniref:Uncharacterized protein n=1 Tax=Octopus vulgaris TaxID=6645 RepID=A0AA36BQ26_OCTVU|nr:Hypothetical predicted protein [Octopus vulgaris]
MLNGRKLSFPESMEQHDVSKRFAPQQFEMKRENVNRRTRNMPYFHDDDDVDRTLLLTYDGGRLMRPQSFHEIPGSCTENKMNNQINFCSKRRSHAEPLESSLMTEDNKDLADNSLALIRVPRHDGEISLRQQTPLHSDILHSQKNYPQQSNFPYVPRKPFLNPYLNPHLQRYNNFHKYTPNRPPFSTGFPNFINNPFRQNCPPFRMNPSGCNCYAQPTRFPTQEYCRFPGHRMKLSNPTRDYEWDFINDADDDHYQWNQNDMDPRTHFEFSNYQRRKHQNNFGLGQPIYCHDAISLQEISADPYRSHFNNETDIDEIEEEYFTYLQKTIPNFNVLPKKSNLKITSLIPEKEEKSLTNSTFASSNRTRNNFGDPQQTARSLMLMRLLKVLEENIDMSNYSMDFQENYVDSHGRLVDPFQTYITDLEQNKLKSQRDEAFVQETFSSRPPVVVLRNRRSDVITLDEGVTLKSSAKYMEKPENDYGKSIKLNNASLHDYLNRSLDVPVRHQQAHQTQQQQREEQEKHPILQSHPEVIVETIRRERSVREDFSQPPSFPVPGVHERLFKTSVEQPIDMGTPWEKEREFQRYNMFKPQFVPETRIYSNAAQIPLSHDIFDGETGKRDVINISQQRLIRKNGDPNEIPYETMAEYFQSSAADINPRVSTKYVFLKDPNSEGIQEDILNKLKCQSKLRSFDEKPFVTEAPDESDPENEVPDRESEFLGRQSFMALKQRFETEKHVQFVDEDNNGSFKNYPYFKSRVDSSDYSY